MLLSDVLSLKGFLSMGIVEQKKTSILAEIYIERDRNPHDKPITLAEGKHIVCREKRTKSCSEESSVTGKPVS